MIREAKLFDFKTIHQMEMQVADMHLNARPDIFKAPQKWSVNEEYFNEMLILT